MTVGTYAPRCPVHPDRHGVRKTTGPNLWLVLHTSEGAETTSSAENLAAYMGMPGDRTTSSGARYGSSYQAVFDTDQIIPAVPNDVVSYSAGGGNAQGVHGCFPGKAGQTRQQWLDANSTAMIRQAAAWLIDQSTAENIPLRRLTVDQVRRHEPGVCDHHDISLAFGKSDHTDIGESFPWDVLWADVATLIAPPTEDDMQITTPRRILDTRGGPVGSPNRDTYKVTAGSTHGIAVSDASGAKCAQVTVTVVEPDAAGHITVWAAGTRPNTSCLNYTAGQAPVTETLFVPVDPAGVFRIWSAARVHLVIDFTGVTGR